MSVRSVRPGRTVTTTFKTLVRSRYPGTQMVLENLGQSLRNELLKKNHRSIAHRRSLVKEINPDIQRALLQADVNVKRSWR
jgi:hypothetical protein